MEMNAVKPLRPNGLRICMYKTCVYVMCMRIKSCDIFENIQETAVNILQKFKNTRKTLYMRSGSCYALGMAADHTQTGANL